MLQALPPPEPGPTRPPFKVPARLQNPLIGHLVGVTAGHRVASAMCVRGEPGTGKTTIVLGTLRALEVAVFSATPEMFESELAGVPVKVLKDLYARAAAVRRPGPGKQPRASAIVLDDAHLSLGRFADTSYTANSQHIHRLLQSLLDNPSEVFGRPTPRIPLYLTANEVRSIPESLRRPGRMTLLHWFYTLGEQTQIINRMFPNLDREDIEGMILEFPGEPPAFYSAIRQAWAERHRRYTKSNLAQTLRLALAGQLSVSVPEPTAADVLDLAREMIIARGHTWSSEKLA